MNRRRFLGTAAGLGGTLLAGCLGSEGASGRTGTFRLLISDQPAAIEAFDSLEVTLSSARVFRADEEGDATPGAVTGTATATPESTPEEGGEVFVEFDLDGATVDLTEVVGDRAVSVLEEELEEGRYSGIELRVAETAGVVDGETVDVTVPSERLRIVRPFEVGADAELSFVFDINVVQKGPRGSYNLLPVVGKSGVAGEDVDVEEVDGGDGG